MKEVKAVEIEINSHCNRACSYCPNVNQTRIEQGMMSKEMFEKILGQLHHANYSGRISFSFYNEPLLSPHLAHFVSRTKNVLPKTTLHLYTNGTLLTEEMLEELIERGVDLFIVTRHENEEHYLFQKVYENLSENFRKKIIYKNFTDLKLTNRGGLLEHIKKSFDSSPLPCMIPSQMLTITNKGTVVPCFEDYHQVHSVGNINEKTIEEIWDSSEYKIFRKKLIMGQRQDYEVCSKCNRVEMLGVY